MSKCKSCGLVNPLNTTDCKRCGASLTTEEQPNSAQVVNPTEASEGQKEPEPAGVWGCIQMLILLAVASVITGYLGLYIREWLPSGPYPMIVLILIFLPAAVVGVAMGIGVVWFINLFIPGIFTKDASSGSTSAD